MENFSIMSNTDIALIIVIFSVIIFITALYLTFVKNKVR